MQTSNQNRIFEIFECIVLVTRLTVAVYKLTVMQLEFYRLLQEMQIFSRACSICHLLDIVSVHVHVFS